MANHKLDQLRMMRELTVGSPPRPAAETIAAEPAVPLQPVSGQATYKYRNADERRAYMANYMRGYRGRKK